MTRLSVYDPFADVFPELFRGMLAPRAGTPGQALEIRIDVKESPADFTVQAEMPGVSRDDIHVQIDGNRVSISAEVKRESTQKKNKQMLHSKRYFNTLNRNFALTTEIDDEKAAARFDNGVLTLTLPKKTAPSAHKLTIN